MTVTSGTSEVGNVADTLGASGSGSITVVFQNFSATNPVSVPTALIQQSVDGATGWNVIGTLTGSPTAGVNEQQSFNISMPGAAFIQVNFSNLDSANTAVFTSISNAPAPPPPVQLPGAPTSLAATGETETSISIAFGAPTTGGTPFTGYLIQHAPTGTTNWTIDAPSETAFAFTISGLTPNTGYDIQVLAINSAGVGTPAVLTDVTTQAIPPPPVFPSAPTVTAGVPTATTVPLSWTVPATGAPILSYNVQRSPHGANIWTTVATNVTLTTYVDSGLTPSTAYDYQVQGVNVAGLGAWGQASATTVAATIPTGMGFDFRSTVAGSAGFAGDPINCVPVTPSTTYAAALGYGWEGGAVSGINESATVDPRLSGINYTSNTAIRTFHVDLPSPGSYKLTLAIGAVNQSGPNFVSIYDNTTLLATIVAGSNNTAGSFFDATAKQYTAALWPTSNNQVTLTFTSTILRIQVGGGASGLTLLAHAFVQPTAIGAALPTAPVNMAVSATGQTTLSVTWSPPTTGEPFNGYDIDYSLAGANSWTNAITFAAGPTYAITGLQINTAYDVRLRADNLAGAGAYAYVYNTTTKAAQVVAPSAPTALSASAITSSSATIMWTAPTGPVTSYTIQGSTNGGTTWTTLGTSATPSFAASGLVANTAYLVRVSATNSGGTSPYSASLSLTTLAAGAGGVPSAPTAMTVTAMSSTSLNVVFGAPTTGAPITGYNVQWVLAGANNWGVNAASSVTSPYLISGASPGTAYDVRVQAVNAQGAGTWSYVYNTSTQSAPATAPPSVPTGLTAINAGTSVTLNWAASTGQGPITYTVSQSTDDVTWSNVGNNINGTSTTITGLTPNVTYYFEVASVNSYGPSVYSAAVSVLVTVTASGTILATRNATNWGATAVPAGAVYSMTHWFKQGQVPSGSIVSIQANGGAVAAQQADNRVAWPDGSLRGAVFMWSHPNAFPVNGNDAVNLVYQAGESWNNASVLPASAITVAHDYQLQITVLATTTAYYTASITSTTLTIAATGSGTGGISGTVFTPDVVATFVGTLTGSALVYTSGTAPAVGNTIFGTGLPGGGLKIISGGSPNFVVNSSSYTTGSQTFTASAITGSYAVGQTLFGDITVGTEIESFGATPGTFNVNNSQTIQAGTPVASMVSTGTLAPGQFITLSTTLCPTGLRIVSQLTNPGTGTPGALGGPGTYQVSSAVTAPSQLITFGTNPTTCYFRINNEVNLGTRIAQIRSGNACSSYKVWGDVRTGPGPSDPIQGSMWAVAFFDCYADGTFRVYIEVHANKLVTPLPAWISVTTYGLYDGATGLIVKASPFSFYMRGIIACVDVEGNEYYSGTDNDRVIWAFPALTLSDPTTTGIYDACVLWWLKSTPAQIAATPASFSSQDDYNPNVYTSDTLPSVDAEGDADHIGPITGKSTIAFLTGQYVHFRRARRTALAALNAQVTYCRDPVSGYAPVYTQTTYPSLSTPMPTYGVPSAQTLSGATATISSHAGQWALYPYLATGREWWLENMQMQADGELGASSIGTAVWQRNPIEVSQYWGIAINNYDLERPGAWIMRNISNAYWLTPDAHPMKAYLLEILNNNYTFAHNRMVNNAAQWGALGIWQTGTGSARTNTSSPWCLGYMTTTICMDIRRGVITTSHRFVTMIIRYVLGRGVDGNFAATCNAYRLGVFPGPATALGNSALGPGINGATGIDGATYAQSWSEVYGYNGCLDNTGVLAPVVSVTSASQPSGINAPSNGSSVPPLNPANAIYAGHTYANITLVGAHCSVMGGLSGIVGAQAGVNYPAANIAYLGNIIDNTAVDPADTETAWAGSASRWRIRTPA